MLQWWLPPCEAEYNTDLVHWTHGILMECYIFMTDRLLDLGRYIAVWTCWLRIRVFVVQVCCINHKGISKHCCSEYCLLRNPKIIRGITFLGPSNRLINVLESGDIWGLWTNTARTNTLYESQWCDGVVGVEHMRRTIPRGTKDSSQVIQGTR